MSFLSSSFDFIYYVLRLNAYLSKSVLMRWRHYNLNAIFSTGLKIPSCSHYLSVENIMLQPTLQTGVVKYVLTFHILTLQFLPCRGKSVYLWLYQTLLGYGKGIVLFFIFKKIRFFISIWIEMDYPPHTSSGLKHNMFH